MPVAGASTSVFSPVSVRWPRSSRRCQWRLGRLFSTSAMVAMEESRATRALALYQARRRWALH
ncbi:hypothetical protein Q2384_24615, partial [Escherichia coli]|nr:hypothetical protein [Escherichia coli]